MTEGQGKQHTPSSQQPVPSLEEIVGAVLIKWKRIAIASLIAGFLVWGINFLIPDYYKASASLLPAPEKGRLSALGQFAEVAALAGVNVPGTEAARLYPSIISSDTVLLSVLQRKYAVAGFTEPMTLIQCWEIDEGSVIRTLDAALKKLRANLTTSFDARTSIVTLTLTLDDPALAADVLNATINELDGFMRSKKTTNASEQVQWIEIRLQQVGDSLKLSENALRRFREKNRRVVDSPELMMEQERLVREVQVSSAVFIELKKQYELAKLEEIKNMTIVSVLDPARPPAIKIGPKRKTNAAIAFLLVFFGMAGYYVALGLYGTTIRRYVGMFRSVKTRSA